MVHVWSSIFDADYIWVEKVAFLSWAANEVEAGVSAKIMDTQSRKGKYDKADGIPSLQLDFELWVWEIPYGDPMAKEFVDILYSQLKNLRRSSHDDVSDALLRADKVIREIKGSEIEYEKSFKLYWSNDKKMDNLFYWR